MAVRYGLLVMLALGAWPAAAEAQTYGSNSPVCLQVFGRFPHFECEYMSIEQCRPSAAARAAQCVVNPYYVLAAGRRTHARDRRYPQ